LNIRLTAAALLLVTACIGCVSPPVGAAPTAGRSALHQLGIANAAKDALKDANLKTLAGMKVWIDVACISGVASNGQKSEDARFLENLITEALVEGRVSVVEKCDAEVVLRGVCEAIGTDSVIRVFPHPMLPLMYYATHRARVKLHLYAYEPKDSQPITVADCQGEYSWSEWSILGLGPYR
jgi:hypothetical protein